MKYMDHKDSYKPDHMPEREEHKYYPYPKPEPKHKKKHETEAILKCGTSMGSVSLCNSTVNGGARVIGLGYGCQPIVLASVTLDTDELVDPTVKIDFSSLISFRTITQYYFLRLVFRLSKVCDGGSPVPLGTWTFEQSEYTVNQTTEEYVRETESFSFSWCECEGCPGCCRYVVELVEEQCNNIDFATIGNISIAALAVGEKKEY